MREITISSNPFVREFKVEWHSPLGTIVSRLIERKWEAICVDGQVVGQRDYWEMAGVEYTSLRSAFRAAYRAVRREAWDDRNVRALADAAPISDELRARLVELLGDWSEIIPEIHSSDITKGYCRWESETTVKWGQIELRYGASCHGVLNKPVRCESLTIDAV